MTLNDIRLSSRQVADLYTRNLVTSGNPPAENPAPAASSSSAPPLFFGQHARGLLIVNNDPDAAFISDADLAIVTKMLEGNGYTLADIAVVNHSRPGTLRGPLIVEAIGSKQILLFGVGPAEFGLPARFPEYQVQSLGNHRYLHAPPLSQLAQAEKEIKRTFWQAMQRLLAMT